MDVTYAEIKSGLPAGEVVTTASWRRNDRREPIIETHELARCTAWATSAWPPWTA